ncbi:ABC transporter ATP-binding protein [Halosquirtibacter laminarini]|uniref:ABC transporter ATP-binding protein n=1 Tax=Halosquirtibacter laminarini TaxID=3374600 RepID=A0AC61ND42_9BACT|nr:ABC transporter ATP-binding protein [Prolixibacteraceae bacterium]
MIEENGNIDKSWISFQNVSKSFGTFFAVDNFSLEIPQGQFLGLIGPNGAGKTTLIQMFIGLLIPISGSITVDGKTISRKNIALKRLIGVVPQHMNLDKDLTVLQNMTFAAKLFGIKGKQRDQRIHDLLKLMGLDEYENRITRRLSGGMARKLMIARALIHDPKILVLDEPTTGVDLISRRKIWEIIGMMRKRGLTVILTSHYIEEVETLSDRIVLIKNGSIVVQGSSKELKEYVGSTTVSYNETTSKIAYRFFKDRMKAESFANSLDVDHSVRSLTLEDVFYHFSKEA